MATKRLKLQPLLRSDLIRQSYTAGEIAVEKDVLTIRVYDGVTKGGHRVALESYVDTVVEGIIAGEVSWNSIPNKPTFATVATSGSYADLSNKPVLFSGSYNDLTSKPTLFSGNYNDLSNKPVFPTNISSFTNDTGYITAINLTWSNITNKPTFATVATSGSYNDLSNKPSIPSAYTLPTATSSVLGGVKIDGTTITIDGNGVISSTGGGGTPYDQSLNTTDDVVFDTVTARQLLSTGVGTPTYTSGSDFIFNTGSNIGELIVNGELSASVGMASKVLTLTPSSTAPVSPIVGMFAVANRTSWDPASKGSGNAYPVFYNGSVWTALY